MPELTLLMTGDLILDEPDPDSFFDPARAVLQSADVLIGHVEVPFTDHPTHYAQVNPGRGSRFEPDPDHPTYPFHPESKNAILGYCTVGSDGVHAAGFLPFWITPRGAPEPLGRSKRGCQVANYIEDITAGANLNARFRWDDDKVRFCP